MSGANRFHVRCTCIMVLATNDSCGIKEGMRSPNYVPSFVMLAQSISRSEALRNEGSKVLGPAKHVPLAPQHSGSGGIK